MKFKPVTLFPDTMRFAYITLSLCFIIITSCAEHSAKSQKSQDSHEKHWSYTGETSPEHWAEIEKNSDCSGTSQSPVNILDVDVEEAAEGQSMLEFFYSPETILKKVRNNGHSVQFDFDKGDSIRNNGVNYNLIQIHFHEPSEHTINGVRFPIEIHLVHQNSDKNYTVLGIMGIEGKECESMERMESFLPLALNEEKLINGAFDLSSLFPERKDYYSYHGSLTTPPCTENVEWIVFRDPIAVSLAEVVKLKENMPLENYRNEQSLNGRAVYLNKVSTQ